MVFKKDLTPIGRRGKVTKHEGKGSAMQRTRTGQRESVTGDNTFDRMTNRYPKPEPEPPASMPMGPMPPDEVA